MQTIPLNRAVLCESCLLLSDTTGSVCPACGSVALWNIARLFDESKKPAKIIWPIVPRRHTFGQWVNETLG